MPFFLSTVNPNSLVMMMLPGIALGQKPSVNASVSESVAGSTSHEAVLPVVAGVVDAVDPVVAGVVDDVSVGALEDPLDAAGNTVTAGEAAPIGVAPPTLSNAMTENLYSAPAVRFEITHDPEAPVISHRPLPGLA